MTCLRLAAIFGVVTAVVVDCYAYAAIVPIRGVISHQHWIIFMYLSAQSFAVSGAVVFAVGNVWRQVRSYLRAGQ